MQRKDIMENLLSREEIRKSAEIIIAANHLFDRGEYIPQVYIAIKAAKDVANEQASLLNASEGNIRLYESELLRINRIVAQQIILDAAKALGVSTR